MIIMTATRHMESLLAHHAHHHQQLVYGLTMWTTQGVNPLQQQLPLWMCLVRHRMQSHYPPARRSALRWHATFNVDACLVIQVNIIAVILTIQPQARP